MRNTRKYNTPTPRYKVELKYFSEWIGYRGQFLFLAWLLVMGFLFLYTQNYVEMMKLDALVREQEMINSLMFRVLWF